MNSEHIGKQKVSVYSTLGKMTSQSSVGYAHKSGQISSQEVKLIVPSYGGIGYTSDMKAISHDGYPSMDRAYGKPCTM